MASHWMWRLAFAILGLGLGGCPDDDSSCLPTPGPINQVERAVGVVVAGQRVRMEVTPASESAGCGTLESSAPIAATAEIEGPDGQPVENQLTLVSRPRTPSILEFTPKLPGPHHITVTFSHIGGLHQFDVYAAWDRSAETPTEPIPVGCESLERTAKGAWVCGTSVVRGSTVVKTFAGMYLAVSGDVLWAVDTTRVQRYVDTGTELVLTASYSHSNGPVEFLLASTEELSVLHSGFLATYFFSSGTLAHSGTSWTRPSQSFGPQGPYGVLLRDGARVSVVTHVGSGDTGSLRVCSYELTPGSIVPPQGTCPSVPGELIGFEPGVLWTRDLPAFNTDGQNQGLVRRWLWGNNQFLEQGSISLGPNATILLQPMKRWEAIPLVRNLSTGSNIPALMEAIAWSPQRKVLLLEHYDSSMAIALASRTFYWGVNSGGSVNDTRIRLRPPTP